MSENQIKLQNYRLGERLFFQPSSGVEKYLLGGWSTQEENHHWTDGSNAKLGLRLFNLGNRDVVLRAQCSGFLAGGELDYQKVEVLVNDRKVAAWNVRHQAWHEALVPKELVRDSAMSITFLISDPSSPRDSGLSNDKRKLGLDFKRFEVLEHFDVNLDDPRIKWIGAGEDAIGDVFVLDENYYRAIKKEGVEYVQSLIDRGVYEELSNRNLIPKHYFKDINHSKYAKVAATQTGVFVYPSNYVLLTLREAAYKWIEINEFLLGIEKDKPYGLRDGHYGNFVLYENSRPLWCDIGSILDDEASLRFGLDQFVRCYVYPLLMFNKTPEDKEHIRHLMYSHPDGIAHAEAIKAIGRDLNLDFFSRENFGIERNIALSRIRSALDTLDFDSIKTFWSNYRGPEALESAWHGEYLGETHDSRFRAVVDVARKSNTSTFIDIGSNDGIFSLLCLREVKKGIAIDVDDFSLNKLYRFISQHTEANLSVSFGGFLDVPHTAELVLALALTHHLSLSQKLSFAEISKKLAEVSSKAVITEFMPAGLGGTPDHRDPYPNPLPDWYTLENFIETLNKDFEHVEVIDYERKNPTSRRILVFCEKHGKR